MTHKGDAEEKMLDFWSEEKEDVVYIAETLRSIMEDRTFEVVRLRKHFCFGCHSKREVKNAS